jgi:transcriptional regulator with AAA-type ATPase domain
MRLFSPQERHFAALISRIAHQNPFLPERIEAEREALGRAFSPVDPVISMRPDRNQESPNMRRLHARAEEIVTKTRGALARGAVPGDDEVQLYEDLALWVLYFRHEGGFYERIGLPWPPGRARSSWSAFAEEFEELLAIPGTRFPAREHAAHLYACFFQLCRAYHHVFLNIIGRSMPAARLRAAVWHSIFTHDMRRYRRALSSRMADATTLIVGPSGTGKELVARAIGLSRYLPFDPARQRFASAEPAFSVLNVAALSPTLVESELFGHRRGAFTGALEDRAGWLETCPPLGAVFLDEVGEIDASIQVKLLRVLQERTFQRLGETHTRAFAGKLIAATNRDLAAEVDAGTFRRDFYYRLCSDVIAMPSLAERLRDTPGELADLVLFLARRVAGEDEADSLAAECRAWIEANLGLTHPWPGNVRELEQCVRNVMIRAEYRPLTPRTPSSLADELARGELSADELVTRYCAQVYARTKSYVETARRLGLDRRTVKARVERQER